MSLTQQFAADQKFWSRRTSTNNRENREVCVSYQSLYEVHLLCFGQRGDSVIKKHGEQLWTQPLLASLAAAAAAHCTGSHNRGLCQGQHPERWVDGEDAPETQTQPGINLSINLDWSNSIQQYLFLPFLSYIY